MSKLSRNWNLWYHDPNNQSYTLDSYINLGKIETIEDFWHYYHYLKLIQIQGSMFFLMLEGVNPLWEDTIDGGSWSYKIDKKEIQQSWTRLSIHLLSDTFLDSDNKDELIGISISPKKTFSILKVWIRNDKIKDEIQIKEDLPYLKNEIPMYRSHLEVKEKEKEYSNNYSNN
jgi:hypothetical protein